MSCVVCQKLTCSVWQMNCAPKQFLRYQKQAAIDHQSKLRLQIERNKVRRAEEKQAEFLEKKYIEKVEAEHAYIVANEGGRCNIHHPIKSMKWFT